MSEPNFPQGLQSVSSAYPADVIQGQVLRPSMPVQVFSPLPVMDVTTMKKRQKAIQEIKKSVMVKDVHFGVIPGCKKDSLLKPGAEVLCQVFGLTPIIETRIVANDHEAEWCFDVERRNKDTGESFRQDGICYGFFEVEAICTLHTMSGAIAGRGTARCSNRENKYRTLCMWDVRNTVEQMAGKRAHVGITRTVTGCSDLFDMDIEDLPGEHGVSGASRSVSSQPAQSNLSPKQQEMTRKFGIETKTHAQVVEYAILHVAKGETKTFMDAMFSKDPQKITAAFEPFAAAARAKLQAERDASKASEQPAASTSEATGPLAPTGTEGGAK